MHDVTSFITWCVSANIRSKFVHHLARCLDNRIDLVTTRIIPTTTACAVYAQTQRCTIYRNNQCQSLAHATHICMHCAALHFTSRATSEKNKHTSHETRSYQQTHLVQKNIGVMSQSQMPYMTSKSSLGAV